MKSLIDFEPFGLPDRVEMISLTVANRFVEHYHYLHRGSIGHRFSLGIYFKNRLVGAQIWSLPTARNEKDYYSTLELKRMVLIPGAPHNAGSRALSLAEHWIKSHEIFNVVRDQEDIERVVRLIAYADSSLHQGTIYRAANWEFVGISKGGSWGNRPHRIQDRQSPKLKFERKIG